MRPSTAVAARVGNMTCPSASGQLRSTMGTSGSMLLNVRCNAVAPGLILGSAFHQQHTPEEMQRRIISTIPLGRAGTTEDVARAVVFFASDINGGVYLM